MRYKSSRLWPVRKALEGLGLRFTLGWLFLDLCIIPEDVVGREHRELFHSHPIRYSTGHSEATRVPWWSIRELSSAYGTKGPRLVSSVLVFQTPYRPLTTLWLDSTDHRGFLSLLGCDGVHDSFYYIESLSAYYFIITGIKRDKVVPGTIFEQLTSLSKAASRLG